MHNRKFAFEKSNSRLWYTFLVLLIWNIIFDHYFGGAVYAFVVRGYSLGKLR
jgi:hypothetical protein